VALPEFVAESQEEPVFEAEPESEEGVPAVDIAAEIPTFLAQSAVSEEAAAATSEPEILLDGEVEEPVAPVSVDESFAIAPEAVAEPSEAEVAPAAHEAPAAPVAGAEVELDIPTIADFTPPETASVPPLPGMEGVDLNLIDDTNLTEEELHAKGEQWLQVATKLDLARAYQEMGDDAGAREILEEVMAEGDAEQKTTAEQLLQMLPSA
jgi:pilus assembly protein FimV